jgi:tRNA(Ile)-lysidine synthase
MKTSESVDLIERVYEELNQLLGEELQQSHFVLGCSGGADSVFLFHALLQRKLNFSVVHINYFKRGDASEADQEFVKTLCSTHQIECHSFAAPKNFEGNFQLEARNFRYECFRQVLALKPHPAYILTAHHADDFTESVFTNS